MTMATDIPQQVVDAILAGVRTATVDVQDVSAPHFDMSKLEVTVVSPFFDGMVLFKRRDLVTKSLNGLRSSSGFASVIVALHLYSPAEVAAPTESAPNDGP